MMCNDHLGFEPLGRSVAMIDEDEDTPDIVSVLGALHPELLYRPFANDSTPGDQCGKPSLEFCHRHVGGPVHGKAAFSKIMMGWLKV